MKKGFTLVEMLVVISILSIFGALILTIFTRSLRGSNKSQIIGVIKQNGQAVLENMDKTIRNADDVVCISSLSPSDTIVVVKGGIYTRYKFTNIGSVIINGSIQQDFPIQPSSGDNSQLDRFLANVCIDPIGTEAQTLTDTDTKTGISVICVNYNCNNRFFSRDSSPGSNDQVTIRFAIEPGVEVSPAIAGQIDPVTFQTTVQLR